MKYRCNNCGCIQSAKEKALPTKEEIKIQILITAKNLQPNQGKCVRIAEIQRMINETTTELVIETFNELCKTAIKGYVLQDKPDFLHIGEITDSGRLLLDTLLKDSQQVS